MGKTTNLARVTASLLTAGLGYMLAPSDLTDWSGAYILNVQSPEILPSNSNTFQ